MNDYKIAFYYSPEDSAYITIVPELPGFMADGKSLQEAIANTKELIPEWIAAASSLGCTIEKPLCAPKYSGANSKDIAKHVLTRTGKITTLAIEKIVYYCKVWSLVWFGSPIIQDRIEAWANGPVFPDLFFSHRGKYIVSVEDYQDNHQFTDDEVRFLDSIIHIYGRFDPQELRALTHTEDPWNTARKGIPDGKPSNEPITDKMILDYYGRFS